MATEPTSGEPHSSRIASWIGNVDIAGEYFDLLHLFFFVFLLKQAAQQSLCGFLRPVSLKSVARCNVDWDFFLRPGNSA